MKAKILLVKPFFEYKNHIEFVYLSALILKNDNKNNIYSLLHETDTKTGMTLLALLAKGAKDADIPFSGGYVCHMSHFHHPWTHHGFLSKTSAADLAVKLFTKAQKNWQLGKKAIAMYHLGRALHLVQDIFIPHHAKITYKHGHGPLERWLGANWKVYRVVKGGYYNWQYIFYNKHNKCHGVNSSNIYDWVDAGSHISFDWYNKFFAHGDFNQNTYHEVAKFIIPNVLRFSAGFIYRFFKDMELN